jgi:cytoskeletal protein RodZ
MTTGNSTTSRNAGLDARYTTSVGNAGKLQIYDGARPATGGAATTKLAEFTLGTPFAPASAAGVLSPTLPANTTGLAAGTATWFRVTTSGGTFVMDGSAGTAATDLILNTATISIGLTCSVTGWTITAGNA